MSHVLIPVLIAAAALVPLAILLWWGARERRQVSSLNEPDLGELKIYKTYWETCTSMLILQSPISVSGVGTISGPSPSQKKTLEFIRHNASELFGSAVVAARAAVGGAAPDAQSGDLRVSGIFLDAEPNSFELLLESESCSRVIPDGVAVSFNDKKINETELVH